MVSGQAWGRRKSQGTQSWTSSNSGILGHLLMSMGWNHILLLRQVLSVMWTFQVTGGGSRWCLNIDLESRSPRMSLAPSPWGRSRVTTLALAGVTQRIQCWPANQRVTILIPSQGTCQGCGPGPQLGGTWGTTTHWCFSPSFSFPSPLSKNI